MKNQSMHRITKFIVSVNCNEKQHYKYIACHTKNDGTLFSDTRITNHLLKGDIHISETVFSVLESLLLLDTENNVAVNTNGISYVIPDSPLYHFLIEQGVIHE